MSRHSSRVGFVRWLQDVDRWWSWFKELFALLYFLALVCFALWVIAFLVDWIALYPVWRIADWLGHPLSKGLRFAVRAGLTLATIVGWYVFKHRNPDFLLLGMDPPVGKRSGPELKARATAPAPPQPATPVLATPPPPPPSQPAPRSAYALALTCCNFEQPTETRKPWPPVPHLWVPAPPGEVLTEAEWLATTDTRALLRHAVPRIPLRHTCLVLAAIAESTWTLWNQNFPGEQLPAFCLWKFGAWCIGEMDRQAVLTARKLAEEACAEILDACTPGPTFATYCAGRAIAQAAAFALLEHTEASGTEAALAVLDWVCHARLNSATPPRAPLTLTSGERDRLERLEDQAVVQEGSAYADLLRRLVPYPWRKATQWAIQDSDRVRAGDALLRLEGWKIKEARAVERGPTPPLGGLN